MPIDYALAGPVEPLPEPPGARGVAVLWLCCTVLGSGAVLLAWPSEKPAQGAEFWFLIAVAPQIVFLLLLGLARHAYESAHLRALYYNQHRDAQLREMVARSQRPLEIVASSYCLPGDGLSLSQLLASSKTVLATQPPRVGAGLVRHSRLPDWDELLSVQGGEDGAEAGAPSDRFDVLVDFLLGPVVESVRELQQRGYRHAPAVRLVDGSPTRAQDRLLQLRQRLDLLGLSGLDCDLVACPDSSRGLMLADDWLDRDSTLPLLLIATQLHEAPPEGSAEAGVALLMVPNGLALPSGVHAIGRLHRPMSCTPEQFGAGCAAALRAGLADAKDVRHLWLAGVAPEADSAVASGLADANLSDLSERRQQCHLDRIVGDAGVVAGWLGVVGAVEAGESAPQLVVTQSDEMQLTVVYSYRKDGDQDVTC